MFVNFEDLSSEILKLIGSKIRTHSKDKITVLTTKEDAKLKLLIIAGDEYLQSGLPDAKVIVKEISPLIKGGGGGQPSMANAMGESTTDLAMLKNHIQGLL